MMTAETLRNFDPAALTLSWNNRRWQIVNKNEVLKDFGSREREAREALQLIHELGVNQYGTIGVPYPVMEYWLINGQGPRALAPGGLRVLDLEPNTLRVEQVQGQWCLCSGQRVVFSFGGRADEARQALGIVQKYGFSQVGVLGKASPSMYLFFSLPTDSQPTMRVGGSSRAMTTPRFSRVAKNADGSPHIEMPAANGGLAGLVAPVVPPLPAGQGALPPGTAPAEPAIASRQSTFWREQPHFGRTNLVSTPLSQSGAERVAFDWRQVQMRQDMGAWKLMAGSVELGNFGASVQDARMALAAMRYYRFTERLHAGDAQHPFSYYLPNAQAPHGLMMGLAAETFEPEKLSVEKAADGYALTAGKQVLVRLGDRADEARDLLEVIKRNKLDRLCKVGEPGKAAMTFLVRSR